MPTDYPRCFKEHERGHRDCGICAVEDECEIETEAEAQAAERRRRVRDLQARSQPQQRAPTVPYQTPPRTTTTTTAAPASGVRVQIAHDQGFFHAVSYNALLEAVTAVFSEGWRSVREVPRLDYRSVWERSATPTKKDP